MLKHSALTLGRVKNVHQYLIKARLTGPRHPLTVQMCNHPCASEQEARARTDWFTPAVGHKYGPAYTIFWFRITGEIPADWAGEEVAISAPVGGERTVWKDNVPERGIDGPHALYRVTDAASGSEKIDLVIQAYTNNPSVRVHGVLPAADPTPETVGQVELVQVHKGLMPLHFDLQYCLSLLEALPEDSPAYASLLRGLNTLCNVLDEQDDSTIPLARKALRDALRELPGEIKHSVTAVGHAHLDTAWLWPLAITHHKMAHTTVNQLYLIDRYPEYVFAHSQASQYEWLLDEQPALLDRIKEAVKRGRWNVVGSMWVEADCNLTGAESLIRQFLFGRRFFQEHFGHPTDDMWLPDVFGYSAALPQILNKFGIQYFLTQKISWNTFNKFPHNTFWWQGIDGSKIWSHFPPADTYVGNGTPAEILHSVRNHKDKARSDHSLYLFGFGDGGGGPTEEHLELLQRATKSPEMPEVHLHKTALDFFQEAKARSKDLVTWSGELFLERHQGTFTSQADNKKFNRQCEFLLKDAEVLSCFCEGFRTHYPKAKLDAAWKTVLLNQFHDIIPGSSIAEVYEDSTRDYEAVISDLNLLIDEKLQKIGGKLETAHLNRPIALFSGADLTTQASIPWPDGPAPGGLRVADQFLPVQLVEALGERSLIFPVPIAAQGAVAVGDFVEETAPTLSRLKARDRRIENDQWSVRFDANGNITSIISLDDRATEFVLPGQLANVFQLLDDHPNFWDAWDVDLFTYETAQNLLKAESFEMVERGPVRVAAEVVRKFGNSRIRQRISLGPTPGIRFDTEIDWQESHKMLKVAFPINVNAHRATYEIQFGHVERPTHSNTSWDMAKYEVPAQKWADISQSDMGVALINEGKYGHDAQGSTLRLSLLRAPEAPDPMCDRKVHRFSYSVLPHFGPLSQSDVVSAAYAFNSPLRASWLAKTAGLAASSIPKFVSVDTRNVVIECVKRAEDEAALIVRMYECHNTRGHATLSLAMPIQRAWVVDLNEARQEELEIVDGAIEFDYAPFEIITVLLEH